MLVIYTHLCSSFSSSSSSVTSKTFSSSFIHIFGSSISRTQKRGEQKRVESLILSSVSVISIERKFTWCRQNAEKSKYWRQTKKKKKKKKDSGDPTTSSHSSGCSIAYQFVTYLVLTDVVVTFRVCRKVFICGVVIKTRAVKKRKMTLWMALLKKKTSDWIGKKIPKQIDLNEREREREKE